MLGTFIHYFIQFCQIPYLHFPDVNTQTGNDRSAVDKLSLEKAHTKRGQYSFEQALKHNSRTAKYSRGYVGKSMAVHRITLSQRIVQVRLDFIYQRFARSNVT